MKVATILDTETTGLQVDKGHRIFEIACVLYDLDTLKHLGSFVKRVNPERPVSAEAARITGVIWENLIHEPVWATIAPQIESVIGATSVLVGHNLEFDTGFIFHHQAQLGFHARPKITFDTMIHSRWATYQGKSPTLSELCFALNVEFDESKAHSALFDTQKTAECFLEGVKRGLYVI